MRMTTAASHPSDVGPSDDAALSNDNRDAEQPERSSRRAFVFFGALAAASFVPRRAHAQQRITRKPRSPAPEPVSDAFPVSVPVASSAPAAWDTSVGRLVRRATLGVTAADVNLAQSMGYQQWLERQLNYTRINDDATKAFVATKYPLLAQTSDQLFSADAGQVRNQLAESTIYRAAFSQRQLYERMVEFWSDHFNMSMDKIGYLQAIDNRDVIRKHALGKFSDLLKASAHSPAMLSYLDQNLSRNTAPNQNYAREIMELHTLGVDGGYSQDDVAELSRVLTGWTLQGRGVFVFNPTIHDWGSKTVLGVTIPAGSPALGQDGIKEGEQMLDLLIKHPSTATFIATKMLRWLLTPTPSATQISTIAGVYRATGGDIKLMARAILNEGWLVQSPVKLKRPFHFLVSGLRSAAPVVTAVNTMNGQLGKLGQVLFDWETPDGYPDTLDYWAGNILPRWNFAITLSNSTSATTVNFDTAAYRAGTSDNAVDLINQNFFGGEMELDTRTALLTYIKAGTFNDARVRETIALALSSNDFQWY
jgi:uncharacterized protein (DUF1800 family)